MRAKDFVAHWQLRENVKLSSKPEVYALRTEEDRATAIDNM